LFRTSYAGSEFSFDYALQLSPLLPKRQELRIDTAVGPKSERTPTTINETPAAVPPLDQEWDLDHPRSWSAAQVATWMYNCGIEHAVVEKFEFHDITGTVLLDLQFQDLKELGIQSFGKRHQVWNQICTLRGGDGRVSPAPTPFQDTDRPVSNLSRSQSQNRPRERSRSDEEAADDCITPITPGAGKRRRRKHRQNKNDPITPMDSASIVAIEQLIPKPHKCNKGENCSKWKKQQRLLRKLHEEHGFPISPEKGGRIFIAGDPGNAASAPKIVDNVQRPVSDALPSDVGPSLVASSDLLGPGEMPSVALHADALRQLEERDPQENVKKFLTLQQVEPPSCFSPVDQEVVSPSTLELYPQLQPPANSQGSPIAGLQNLPRLEIPRNSTLQPNHDVFSADYNTGYQTAFQDTFSPCRTVVASPDTVYRFGTPASEMDVPVTALPIDPFNRETTSQSVPPNMHFHHPTQRSSSRLQSRRPSQPLATVPERETVSPNRPSHRYQNSSSSDPDYLFSPKAASDGDETPNALTYNANHHGWMKKRKTKLLRHEWNDHHFRLHGNNLAMHADDHPASNPLDTLNIDDYAVACSSLASNKLSAKLKAFKISQDKNKHSHVDAPFSFQLVPTIEGSEREMGKLQKAMAGAKTHHFAVRSRDERIDWMRELMLAKALRAKGEGYAIEVNGNAM
jgi:SAM domain (Sterile alpha motif)/PH domain